jgi:hypothetical protein
MKASKQHYEINIFDPNTTEELDASGAEIVVFEKDGNVDDGLILYGFDEIGMFEDEFTNPVYAIVREVSGMMKYLLDRKAELLAEFNEQVEAEKWYYVSKAADELHRHETRIRKQQRLENRSTK